MKSNKWDKKTEIGHTSNNQDPKEIKTITEKILKYTHTETTVERLVFKPRSDSFVARKA